MKKINQQGRQAICRKCGQLLDDGYHCSEAMVMGLGQLLLPVHPQVLKAATGFAGGVGEGKEELCGGLAGGIMVIGLLHGRTDARDPDEECERLCDEYRRRFLAGFGYTKCRDLRENWRGKPGQEHCAQLVEKAAGILLEVLGE